MPLDVIAYSLIIRQDSQPLRSIPLLPNCMHSVTVRIHTVVASIWIKSTHAQIFRGEWSPAGCMQSLHPAKSVYPYLVICIVPVETVQLFVSMVSAMIFVSSAQAIRRYDPNGTLVGI